MTAQGPDACLDAILALNGGDWWDIDRVHAVRNVTAFVIRSFDGDALLFTIPLRIHRPILPDCSFSRQGAPGAVACIIEQIKQKAGFDLRLGPLVGKGTRFPHRFGSFTEPYTLVASPAALASDIWHAGDRNYADESGVHLLLNGAVPYPPDFSRQTMASFTETVAGLCDAITSIVSSIPVTELKVACIATLDQQLLRETLLPRGLVAFVGDGTRLARHYTRYRGFFRTAGPGKGVNIPFSCPRELEPCELELPASNRTVTGLGVRSREVFAVAGSNAQGKSTFLEGILAGVDDHARGDGRELVVTVPGPATAEAMNCLLTGADISMFFSTLPPGIGGTVHAASGMGSGSMNMAHQVQRAIERRAPLLIIDEDRAAPNLLVRSCLQTGGITPLSEILCHQRHKMGKTALIFAACAMDTLVAQADRIMVLDQHVAYAVNRDVFRAKVAESMEEGARDLRNRRHQA